MNHAMRGDRGLTVIELLVATAIFAMFVIVVDAVFFTAHRSSKKAELAADVQQNARIAVERLTREIRESGTDIPGEIRFTNSVPGHSALVFKSARLPADNQIFCLYVRNTTDPSYMNNADCFTFSGGNITPPPYGASPASPLGTYTPIWQRYLGYFVVDTPDGMHELRRVAVQLNTTDAAIPDPATLSGGDVIATMVETFDITLVGGEFRVSLKAKGSQLVQGVAVPDQEVVLPGTVQIRN